MTEGIVRIWQIGPDGTEYYAARSEDEMRAFYIEMVGQEQAYEDFIDAFDEVLDIDSEFPFNDDGTTIKTSWREQAEGADLPTQIATGYN